MCRASRVARTSALGRFDAREPVRSGEWWDYVAGVVRELSASGARIPQLDIAISSDVPAGAGLSSSAAVEVATAFAIADLLDLGSIGAAGSGSWRGARRQVSSACRVESWINSRLRSPAKASALHVWCDTMRIEQVRCEEHVLIFDTGVHAETCVNPPSPPGATNARARWRRFSESIPRCESSRTQRWTDVDTSVADVVLRKRATHVVKENIRVKLAVVALQKTGIIPGELLVASHASLRDLYECSSPELDWFVEHALTFPGVRGARLTGAGWGGCAIATGEPEALSAAVEPLEAAYAKRFRTRRAAGS